MFDLVIGQVVTESSNCIMYCDAAPHSDINDTVNLFISHGNLWSITLSREDFISFLKILEHEVTSLLPSKPHHLNEFCELNFEYDEHDHNILTIFIMVGPSVLTVPTEKRFLKPLAQYLREDWQQRRYAS